MKHKSLDLKFKMAKEKFFSVTKSAILLFKMDKNFQK